MDITASDFIKQASSAAEYFGFAHVDTFKKNPVCTISGPKLQHTASASDRKSDALYGLLTGGINAFADGRLQALEAPVLFYSLEQVPRTGEAALSLQIFGVEKSIAEAILIQTARALLSDLNLPNHTVRINSLGDRESTNRYTRELTNYLKKRLNDLPITARELMKEHVITALMHLIEKDHVIGHKSPNPLEYLSDPSRKHFREIVEYLDMTETPYEIDSKLLGHHDCYSDAIFSIDLLDEEDQRLPNPPLLIRGGRYNRFVEKHTSRLIPAAGAVVVLKEKRSPARAPRMIAANNHPVYVVQLGFGPKVKSLLLIDELRRAGIAVQQNLASNSLSTQLREAEDRNVPFAIIIGQKEYVDKTVILRDMQARTQEAVPISEIVSRIKRVS